MMYPPYISWEVNSECNHDCFYCYNYWRTDKENVCNESIDYGRICDFIISQKPRFVTITGGEPLLVFDNIKECLVKMREAGIQVRIATNGACITEDLVAFAKQLQLQFMISFPSIRQNVFEETTNRVGALDRVIRGMDLLASFGVHFSQNIVVTEKNLDSLEDTVRFLKERYNIGRIYISRAAKPVNASNELDTLLLSRERLRTYVELCARLQNKYRVVIQACGGFPFCALETQQEFQMFAKGCGGGEHGYVISGNGDVRVCPRDYLIYGNIFETPIEEICQKMRIWTKDEAIPEECRDCNMKKLCRGGCHMASVSGKHTYQSLDYAARPECQPIKYIPSGETCMTRYRKWI